MGRWTEPFFLSSVPFPVYISKLCPFSLPTACFLSLQSLFLTSQTRVHGTPVSEDSYEYSTKTKVESSVCSFLRIPKYHASLPESVRYTNILGKYSIFSKHVCVCMEELLVWHQFGKKKKTNLPLHSDNHVPIAAHQLELQCVTAAYNTEGKGSGCRRGPAPLLVSEAQKVNFPTCPWSVTSNQCYFPMLFPPTLRHFSFTACKTGKSENYPPCF